LVVGGFLVIYGLQWLVKAILRAAGAKAKHDEASIYEAELVAMREEPPASATGMDWISFTVAFKGVLLEGLEVAFIVVTFGASAGQRRAGCPGSGRRGGPRGPCRNRGPRAPDAGPGERLEVRGRADADDLRGVLGG